MDIIADRFSGSHLLTLNQNSTAEIKNAVGERITELNYSSPADVQGVISPALVILGQYGFGKSHLCFKCLYKDTIFSQTVEM
jgi:hypothetical protein